MLEVKEIREESDKALPVTRIIEEVCDEICTHYCKWPDNWTDEANELCDSEVCAKCPLNRLQ